MEAKRNKRVDEKILLIAESIDVATRQSSKGGQFSFRADYFVFVIHEAS